VNRRNQLFLESICQSQKHTVILDFIFTSILEATGNAFVNHPFI
jgi:hypothetical protein